MSELKQVKDFIDEKLNIYEGEYKAEVEKITEQGKSNSEALVKMDERIEQLCDATDKINNRLKQQVAIKEFAEGAVNHEEIKECYKGMMDVGRGRADSFDTGEMKSAKEFKTQFNERDDAAGGITVPPTIDSLLDKLIREFSNVRALSSVATIAGDKWERMLLKQTNGAVRRKALDNFDDATKKDKFGRVTIMVADLFSIIPFTDNLEMDSMINIVSEILSGAAEEFAITEGQEFVTGDGVEEMKGILTYEDGTGFDKVERTQSGTTLKLDFDDVFNLIYSLKTGYQPGAKMFANRLTMRVLRKLTDAEGRYLWEFSQQVGQPANIAGYGLFEMPELVAPNSSDEYVQGVEPIIFGDLGKGYKIVDRLGITTTRDNLTQYPDVVYKLKKRSGGGLVKGEAIKTLQIS